MKPLFILYCLLLTLQSKAANDTLTRAQVYNFSVGILLIIKRRAMNMMAQMVIRTIMRIIPITEL